MPPYSVRSSLRMFRSQPLLRTPSEPYEKKEWKSSGWLMPPNMDESFKWCQFDSLHRKQKHHAFYHEIQTQFWTTFQWHNLPKIKHSFRGKGAVINTRTDEVIDNSTDSYDLLRPDRSNWKQQFVVTLDLRVAWNSFDTKFYFRRTHSSETINSKYINYLI